MFYRAVAATCPGNDKEYKSNDIYLNTKYITDDIKSSEVLLKQKKEQEGLQFYGITEGFGADRYTDEASLIAIKKLFTIQKKVSGNEISDNYDEAADLLYSYLEDFVKESNEAIIAKSAELPDNNIYTSVAVMALYETAVITCNLGNTRIYLFRKGNLSCLSEDHNQAQVMYKNGVITADKVAAHPKRNKLTQYLGAMPEGKQTEPYYSEVEVKHGDIFIICSSAFCNSVDDESLCDMVRSSRSLSQIAEKLMQAAATKGFTEDTSILVVRADAHEKAVAPVAAGMAAASAASGNSAAAKEGAKASGKAASAKKSRDKTSKTKDETFTDKMKRFLGLSSDSENEKVWPALLTFGCCILVVIILTVLGIKIYNASKSPASKSPTNPPSANVGTPSAATGQTATSAPTPTPAITPTPSENQSTPTQVPTKSPATEEPTQAPTEPPATEEPTQAPTEPPATEEPTQAPTEPPVTEEPTQAPTEPPVTEEPTPPEEATPAPEG